MQTSEQPEKKRQSGWQIIRALWPYLWVQETWVRVRIVLALASLGIAKIFTVSSPLFLGYAVDSLTPGTITPEGWIALGATSLVIFYGLSRLLGVGFSELRDFIFAKVAQRAIRALALRTFSHIHALSLRFHLTRKTGTLIRIVERGVKGVDFLLRFLLFSVGPLIIELSLVAMIFFIKFDWRYFVAIVLTVSFYVYFTFMITEMRVKIRTQMNEADQTANQHALDSLLNYETVKYFVAEDREARRYDTAMARYEKTAIRTSETLSLLNFVQSATITLGFVVILLMAAFDVQAGKLTTGEFVSVNAYMILVSMPLNFLGTVYREIRQSLVDMSAMFEMLSQDPEIMDTPNAEALDLRKGLVRFEKINFGYEAERSILHSLDLVLPAGKTLAVVGSSGSGKSTLTRLLYRFYDPQSGRITIDDQDISKVTQSSLRQNIGIVPQDTVLFNDTIAYNIAYGKEGATKDEIERAARAARIHDFIINLPKGYATEVGERGLKLSGGEKQRVGIARTLLKNPPILILDEATSALDTETEKGIVKELHAMSQGRTVLTIAHRLSTVVGADEIIVLEKGLIIERGAHIDLIERGGRYADMWAQQLAEAEKDTPEVS